MEYDLAILAENSTAALGLVILAIGTAMATGRFLVNYVQNSRNGILNDYNREEGEIKNYKFQIAHSGTSNTDRASYQKTLNGISRKHFFKRIIFGNLKRASAMEAKRTK